MTGKKDIFVERRDSGDFALRRPNSLRASAVLPTQKEAISKAEEMTQGTTGAVHVARVRYTKAGEPGRLRKK